MKALSTKKNKTTLVLVVVGILIIAFVVITYTKKNSTPAALQASEEVTLMQKVGSHMLVPNEKPIIATINEAEKLTKEQPFYLGATNGDKLIIFPKSHKAIIYSPTKDVIVNSGPFVINNGVK